MGRPTREGEDGNNWTDNSFDQGFDGVDLSLDGARPRPLANPPAPRQTPLALEASKIKENNAISHLTDDNNILYPLLPSDTLDQ